MIRLRANKRQGAKPHVRLIVTVMICGIAISGSAIAEAVVTDMPVQPETKIVLAQADTSADAGQKAADDGSEAVRVPESEAQRQNMTQPAETAPMPSIVGYFEGEDVLFTHAEISDPTSPNT